ncbi:MAG TPA: AAA family ATPase, partial [Bacillota bacterium]|nr:AAA family ATPase [Bacillota bacterium]
RLANGNYQVVIQGLFRAETVSMDCNAEALIGTVRTIDTPACSDSARADVAVIRAYNAFHSFVKFVPRPSDEVFNILESSEDVGFIADVLAASLVLKYKQKQQILEIYDPIARIDEVSSMLERDAEIFELEGKIQSKVKTKLQKTQRDIYLKEQMAAIKAELGYDEEDGDIDSDDEYREAIAKAKLPDEVRAKLKKEASKLSKMVFGSSEGSVIRAYIDTCLELPWEKLSKDRIDIAKAKKILDDDHDGLEKVKERILEYLSVKRLTDKTDGQIICLVGPPGVGKTSVARSIAHALNKKYARIALGGIRDEAEIRGHRKTYIGSMPGRIITCLKQAGTRNPLILLDEIDKLTRDMHGDPSSALLEVLDSDQNKTFRDNFIELPFDLSQCMFIATANTVETIPPALLDRMEVIEMGSYTDEQKMSIAKNHLVEKQMKKNGLTRR